MVSRNDGGSQIILSAGVRKTIQSIKEIVGNHSDAEIYSTLKETNMDPNETAQKLLNQDPFHEVKRKRDKRKEVTTNMVYTASQQKKHSEPLNQGTQQSAHSDNNIRSRGIIRNSLSDAKVGRDFRVVRDNRTNHKTNSNIKPPVQSQISSNEPEVQKFANKSSLNVTFNNQKQPVGRHSSKSPHGITDPHPRQPKGVQINDKKEPLEVNRDSAMKAVTQMQTKNTNYSKLSTTSSNNSVAGVYSSSSDPVHVPSPDSRPAANIGAIKREVGAVGVRRLSTEISAKGSSAPANSFPNSHLGRDGPSRDTFKSSAAMSKNSHPTQNTVNESTLRSNSVTRPFVNNQHVNRQHQHQSVGHQKASSHSNKEWKPKSSQKQSSGPGVIGTPSKSSSPPADAVKNLEAESVQSPSRIDISDNQNVIIAPHIRVSATDRFRVTFGSVGTGFDPSKNPGFEAVESSEKPSNDPSASVSIAAHKTSGDELSGSKQEELIDEHVCNSGTSSPASAAVSEQQVTGRKESSGPQGLDNNVGLVSDNSQSYNPSESQQHQDPPQLPIFSAYDPQTMYDVPYFRSAVDETAARVQSLQFPQEAISSHTVNSIPSSTVAMVQQPQLAQMYPQVHVPHYANIMPYRQYLSPVYVPPMAVPAGYSSNPAYPHPSNGNSYLLMPGGSSHLPANGVKYGIQQFKPVPTGSQTGFGNFTSPNGYAINAPGGSAAGLEDSSRMKYKDGNLYVPNPQAETSEIWMNPRDLPSMQSGSYYSMTGQTPHAAYLPSHTSHASFNAAAQSSHVQFPGMYHTPQPAGIPSPHHPPHHPAVGGNVGVGLAAGGPATQVNAFQQPQLGHMNWTGNF